MGFIPSLNLGLAGRHRPVSVPNSRIGAMLDGMRGDGGALLVASWRRGRRESKWETGVWGSGSKTEERDYIKKCKLIVGKCPRIRAIQGYLPRRARIRAPFRNTRAAEMMTIGRKIGSPIVHAIICACSRLSEEYQNPGQAMAGKDGTFYARKGSQHALS